MKQNGYVLAVNGNLIDVHWVVNGGILQSESVPLADVQGLDALSKAPPDLLAALEELLSAGPCDICYEDPCDPTWCECKCHRRELDAWERAQVSLARVRGES